MPFTHKLSLGCAALLSLAFLPPALLQAQDDGPPNVLVVQREYLKPGKSGMLHERSESAFVRAFANAKYPTHYFALDSLSGASRALFLVSYNSFADWEKDNLAVRADKTLGAAVDHATQMDGDLLTSYDSMVLTLRPDLSLGKGSIQSTRYFEITTFVVKPGHDHEFEEIAHMYQDGFRKAAPDAQWDCFEVMYGSPAPNFPAGSVYAVFTLMKSMSEVDKEAADFKKFGAEMGAGGMKKMAELTASSIEATSTNLFEINPRMSYPPQQWIDKEPAFWKVTPTAAPKKPTPKPENP